MPTLIRVKVHPRSRENRVEPLRGGGFELWVRAEAEAGRANEAVLELLARELRLERKRLRVFKGATSPSKLIQVLGESRPRLSPRS